MNAPRKTFFLGGAAMVLGILAWLSFRQLPSSAQHAAPSSVSSTLSTETAAISIAPAQPVAGVPEPTGTIRPSIIDPRGSILTNGKPLEEVYIQYWAELYGFELTNDELARAQAAYNAITKARRTLEDDRAKVKRLDAGHFEIMIPSYPVDGQKLRQELGRAWASIFGSARAEQFLAAVEVRLDRANFGWGMVDQVIDVTLRRVSEVETLEIAHGFALPNTGPLSDIAGVSVSKLSPEDLSIYAHLGRHFPKHSAN